MAKQKKAGKKKSNIPDITNAGPSDHAKLKATVAEIVRIAGFKCDTEIHLNFTGNQNESANGGAERVAADEETSY